MNLKMMMTVFTFASLSICPQGHAKEHSRKTGQLENSRIQNSKLDLAIQGAKLRNSKGGFDCEDIGFEVVVLDNLKEAVKENPQNRFLAKKNKELKKALAHNLIYQQLIGDLGPNMENIEKVLPKAQFMSVAMGVYGSAHTIEMKGKKGTLKTSLVPDDDFETFKKVTTKGTYKINRMANGSIKVSLDNSEYTLKKMDYFGQEQFILIAPGEENTEYLQESLFNNIQGECEA